MCRYPNILLSDIASSVNSTSPYFSPWTTSNRRRDFLPKHISFSDHVTHHSCSRKHEGVRSYTHSRIHDHLLTRIHTYIYTLRWADRNDIFFHHCTFYWQGMLNLYTGSNNILTKYEVPRINFRGATGHLNIWSF